MSATITQYQTVASSPADWSQTVNVPQFDPAFGTLQDINVGLAGTLSDEIAIESGEASPATVGFLVTVISAWSTRMWISGR